MATVLSFPPTSDGDRIPTPFNHREGDSYIRLSFEDADCPPLGFSYWAVFIARLGSMVDGTLHVINTPDGALIASLTVKPDGQINVLSYHPDYPSRVCALKELDILGPVAEIWPHGFAGHRYVLNPASPDAEPLTLPLVLLSN